MKSAQIGTGILVGCAALLAGGAAFAQDVGVQTTQTTTTTTTPVTTPAPAGTPPAPTQTGMTLPGTTPDPAADADDHASVVGHFGVGYMGRRTININPGAPGVPPQTVDAPIIGARYWLDPMIGIDAGLGVLFSGGSNKTGDTSVDTQGFTVLMLHGGVPLALAGSKHFSFQIVPELNFGLAWSKTAPAGGADGSDLNGIHFDIGARAGGEVQFGFIGIPQLSLQAGVGLALAYDRSKISPPGGMPATSVSSTRFGTNTGDNPWNIFTGNIAALYYFN